MLRNCFPLIVEIPHLRRFARSLARNPDAAAYVVYAPDNRHPVAVAATEAGAAALTRTAWPTPPH